VTLRATGTAASPQGAARPLNSHATAKVAVRQ